MSRHAKLVALALSYHDPTDAQLAELGARSSALAPCRNAVSGYRGSIKRGDRHGSTWAIMGGCVATGDFETRTRSTAR